MEPERELKLRSEVDTYIVSAYASFKQALANIIDNVKPEFETYGELNAFIENVCKDFMWSHGSHAEYIRVIFNELMQDERKAMKIEEL